MLVQGIGVGGVLGFRESRRLVGCWDRGPRGWWGSGTEGAEAQTEGIDWQSLTQV